MPKITDRERSILLDYRDVKDDKSLDRDGWAYPSELGYSAHGFKKLVLWNYLEMDGTRHSADTDYRITSKGVCRLTQD